jgi:phage terminase large subunit-like protein
MLPKDEIDLRVRYESGGGFRGFKEPRIPFVDGPGKGSVIIFATYKQGGSRIAGGAYHGAYLDEPPPEKVLGEVMPRLSRYHGFLRISMTPTPESPPLGYLKDLLDKDGKRIAKEQRWRELQTSLTPGALTLRGGIFERPWKTPAEIDELIESYLEVEREMRVHGSWDALVKGRWLTNFTDAHIWTGELGSELAAGEGVRVAVGIDHGAKAGRQCATLVVCSLDGQRVWYLDEARSDGRTSIAEDAQAVLDMLARQGWTWENVDYWIGDRPHGGDMHGNDKSNIDLLDAFSRILKVPRAKLVQRGLRLSSPRKFQGSMGRGVRLMNNLFRTNQAKVHLRCQGLIRGAKEWEGDLQDPLKDPIDSARYPTEVLRDVNVLRPRVSASSPLY